jgi:uncharacterized protein YkwD
LARGSHLLAVFAASFFLFGLVPAALAAPASSSEAGVLAAVNAARTAHGLRPLRLDLTLRSAARSHSADMLHRNYFAHGAFAARMAAFHVQGRQAGENLAWGSGPYGRAGAMIGEWLASPEHRANLLSPVYSRIGIGLVRGSFQGTAGATVVTADFAG